MDILIVTPSYYPIVGGSEALTRVLSRELNEQGVHTDIMTFNMNEKWNPAYLNRTEREGYSTIFKISAINPLPNLPNPLSNLLMMNLVPRPTYVHRLNKYDVIHFIGEADLTFPISSYFVKRPKIMHCVGIFRDGGIYQYYTAKRPYLGKIFKKFFSGLADIFLVSSDGEKKLLSNLGVPLKKISVVPIGVDVDTFKPDEAKRTDDLVLFVGRIDRVKGIHILIEAISKIETPIELVIIGPIWDPEYFEEIRDMSYRLNQEGIRKVRFLGAKEQVDLVPWYQRASVLVCPYLYETFSNVIRESLACGTPVISTGSHMIDGGSDGILLVSKDSNEVAEALEELLGNVEMRSRLGREGRKVIEDNFSWKSIVKELIRLYTHVQGRLET